MSESHCEHTLSELFKQAIEIEYKFSKVYSKLSILFSHVPDISAFWDGFAREEIFHMNTLQDIHKSLTQEQLLSPAERKMWEGVVMIRDFLGKDLIGSIKNLDDAYELAHELEFSEVNAIFKFLAIKVVPSDEREKFIISHIEQHQKKLMDFSKKFGDRVWRKQIFIQRS